MAAPPPAAACGKGTAEPSPSSPPPLRVAAAAVGGAASVELAPAYGLTAKDLLASPTEHERLLAVRALGVLREPKGPRFGAISS